MAPRIKLPCRKRTRKTCRNASRSCVYISSVDGKNYCKSRNVKRTRKRINNFKAKKPNLVAIRLAEEFDNSPKSSKTYMFQPNVSPDLFDKSHSENNINFIEKPSFDYEAQVSDKPIFRLSSRLTGR